MEALAITTRPKVWDEVIGQDRAVRVLQGIFKRGKFNPRALIMEGPHGTGKTSMGYIAAKAMMCVGGDPLGCGKCASCLVFQEHPEAHPEFKEVDAASYSGVNEARRIVEEATELPALGRVRVVLIDEAHRLSREAWDVYLKPLEAVDSKCVFIFSTTDSQKIPKTVKSRSVVIPFGRVATELIHGLLVSVSARSGLDYEMDGLKALAKAARGHVRDALVMLDKVSGIGRVTKELVDTIVDTSYSDQAARVWINLIANDLPKAASILDEMSRTQPPAKAIQEMFATYGRAVFGDPNFSPEEQKRYGRIKQGFPDPARVTDILLKWTGSERIPADALPIFAYELHSLWTRTDTRVTLDMSPLPKPAASQSPAPSISAPAAPPAKMDDIMRTLNAVTIKRPTK